MASKLSVVRVRAIFRTFAIAAEHDGGSGALCGEGGNCTVILCFSYTIVPNFFQAIGRLLRLSIIQSNKPIRPLSRKYPKGRVDAWSGFECVCLCLCLCLVAVLLDVRESLMPAATHISTPFAPPEAAPPPRVILLAHTDLDSYAPVALLMHENLALARPRNAEAMAPAHTYPPAPIEKIASPSKLSRILLENAPEWKEGTQLASEIKVRPAILLSVFDSFLRVEHRAGAGGPASGLALRSFAPGGQATGNHLPRGERVILFVSNEFSTTCEAAKSHPQLDKYANNWPVRCVLMAHLKITSREATKRKDILKKVKKEERAVKKEVRARIKNRDRGKGRGGGKPVQRRRDRRDESDDSESSSSSSLTSLTSR